MNELNLDEINLVSGGTGSIEEVAQSTATFAGIGAGVGSALGPAGAAVGAAIGAVAGFFAGIFLGHGGDAPSHAGGGAALGTGGIGSSRHYLMN